MRFSNPTPVNVDRLMRREAEVELENRLAAATMQAGVRADRIDVANFHVALKHRPIVILAWRAGSGKAAVVKCLGGHLAGGGLRGQILSGHAWYAGRGVANAFLIGTHTRLITKKILCMIEEALQPESAQQMFFVGLIHISPAELLSFFTEVAYEIPHNRIIRIGDTHLSATVPFPFNLLLIGTMDTTEFGWWDEDLLSGATVIEWHADMIVAEHSAADELHIPSNDFLHSSLRNSQKAYERLNSVVAGTKQPLNAALLVRDVLRAHGLEFSPALLDAVILYMANSWSARGSGMFDPSTARNLAVAFDLAIAQLVLPRYFKAIRSQATLRADLYELLDEHLPRSSAFLARRCEGHSSLT